MKKQLVGLVAGALARRNGRMMVRYLRVLDGVIRAAKLMGYVAEVAKLQRVGVEKYLPVQEELDQKYFEAILTLDTVAFGEWLKEMTLVTEPQNKEIIMAVIEDMMKKYHARNRPIDATPFN
jgi:hypothetical protein